MKANVFAYEKCFPKELDHAIVRNFVKLPNFSLKIVYGFFRRMRGTRSAMYHQAKSRNIPTTN